MNDIKEWFLLQVPWSRATFGAGPRANGVCDHIESELKEIRANPDDLSEWVDVITLGFDGASRQGYSYDEIVSELHRKQTINFLRKWPAPTNEDKSVEHIRDDE
jgi:hypothetical protein